MSKRKRDDNGVSSFDAAVLALVSYPAAVLSDSLHDSYSSITQYRKCLAPLIAEETWEGALQQAQRGPTIQNHSWLLLDTPKYCNGLCSNTGRVDGAGSKQVDLQSNELLYVSVRKLKLEDCTPENSLPVFVEHTTNRVLNMKSAATKARSFFGQASRNSHGYFKLHFVQVGNAVTGIRELRALLSLSDAVLSRRFVRCYC